LIPQTVISRVKQFNRGKIALGRVYGHRGGGPAETGDRFPAVCLTRERGKCKEGLRSRRAVDYAELNVAPCLRPPYGRSSTQMLRQITRRPNPSIHRGPVGFSPSFAPCGVGRGTACWSTTRCPLSRTETTASAVFRPAASKRGARNSMAYVCQVSGS
jgi:hypothetical protein